MYQVTKFPLKQQACDGFLYNYTGINGIVTNLCNFTVNVIITAPPFSTIPKSTNNTIPKR